MSANNDSFCIFAKYVMCPTHNMLLFVNNSMLWFSAEKFSLWLMQDCCCYIMFAHCQSVEPQKVMIANCK